MQNDLKLDAHKNNYNMCDTWRRLQFCENINERNDLYISHITYK